MKKDKEHPYKTGSNTYHMSPLNLISLGINIDQNCVVCGEDQSEDKLYYVDEGSIHCVRCSIKHEHTTQEDYLKYKKEIDNAHR